MMGFLQRIDTQLDLFGRMSSHAEVGYEDASGFALEQDMRRAFTRCIFCRQSEDCRDWLNSAPAGLYPGFCRNAAFLDRYGRAAARQADRVTA
jgi:hypothetical protein